jgi:hypothetical protein
VDALGKNGEKRWRPALTRTTTACGTEIICIMFPFSAFITETADPSFQKSFGFGEKIEGLGELM